jgi:hypothetical protein
MIFCPTWLLFLISIAFQPLLTIVFWVHHLGDSNFFSFMCILIFYVETWYASISHFMCTSKCLLCELSKLLQPSMGLPHVHKGPCTQFSNSHAHEQSVNSATFNYK